MLQKLIVCVSVFVIASCAVPTCVSRDYGYGSPVCVCNSTYCDVVEPTTVDQLTAGVVRHYVTTKAGKRLEPMTMKFSSASEGVSGNVTTFKVNRKTRYQEMFGFGGAATDSATMNTYSLSSGAAEKLISAYFAEEGIGYTFIRVPMGGCDFSWHKYEYTDNFPNDTTLKNYNLSAEDYNYKIPFIKQAKKVSPSHVKLFTAAWSAPDWMKNIKTKNGTSLKEEYYQVYANYYVKFFEFYAAEGLDFWGMTPQNEPSMGLNFELNNTMGWTAQQMLKYLVNNLCPTLKSTGHSGLKLMINDDQRSNVDEWLELYKDKTIQECVSGMAIHWYTDNYFPASILSKAHEQYPEKFMLHTEACVMHGKDQPAVALGSWNKGEQYMTDIIEVTNNWVTGWVDWNMALDLQGGPNWVDNTVDSPVAVNATADEFYKQPMFYALAHFSKFVPPGSVHIGLESQQDGDIENVAFLTPEKVTVVILHNKADKDKEAVISDPDSGSVSLKIPANSMHTILFK